MNDNNYDDGYIYEEEGRGGPSKYKITTFIILAVHLLLAIGTLGFLVIVNILPIKHLAIIGAVILIGWAIQFFLLYKSKTLKTTKYTFSNILSICFVGVAVIVFIYFGGTSSLFSNISSGKDMYDIYTIRVLVSSELTDISQVKGNTIGYSSLNKEEDIEKCKTDLTNKISASPKMKAYDEGDALVEALFDKDIKVMLFDEAMTSSVEEHREGFAENTRVLYEIKIPVTQAGSSSKRENIDVKKDPFNVLITGVDSAGKIASRGNSDVNIIATINPKTKKILLTSTPRDFYVPLNGDKNKYDKLTHAGNYGAQCSMDTLSKYYNTPIDFYVKVNFTSVEDLVDALGGVTVNSDVAFSAPLRSGGRVAISKGNNNLKGAEALAFSRERKSLAGGDRARGKHQQMVISAIVDKLTSPAIVTRYNGVIGAIEKNTVTDMSSGEMKDLVKMQIDSPSSWTTESISVDGTGDNRTTYSYKKRKLYVMIPDEATVTAARAKIAQYMK